MDYSTTAKAFALHLKGLRGAKKAPQTWDIVRKSIPGLHADFALNFTKALDAYRACSSSKLSLPESRKSFIEDVHNLSKSAGKWTGCSDGTDLRKIGIEIKLVAKTETLMISLTELQPDHDPAAERAVKAFFEAVQAKKLDIAWNMLDPEYQERRWDGDPLYFKEGYKYVLTYRRVRHFVVEANSGLVTIDVFYEEDQYIPHIQEIEDINYFKVSEIGKFCVRLEQLKTDLTSIGANREKLESLPLNRLFLSDAALIVPYDVAIKKKAIDKKYGYPALTVLQRARRFRFKKFGDRWLITSIGRLSS